MAAIDQILTEVARALKRAMEDDRPIDVAQVHYLGIDRIVAPRARTGR